MVIRVLFSPQKFIMSISLAIFPPQYFCHLLGPLCQDLQLSYFPLELQCCDTTKKEVSIITSCYCCSLYPDLFLAPGPSCILHLDLLYEITIVSVFFLPKTALFPKSFWEFGRQKESYCGGNMDKHSTQIQSELGQSLNLNSKPQNISKDLIEEGRFVNDGSPAGRFGNLCCIQELGKSECEAKIFHPFQNNCRQEISNLIIEKAQSKLISQVHLFVLLWPAHNKTEQPSFAYNVETKSVVL